MRVLSFQHIHSSVFFPPEKLKLVKDLVDPIYGVSQCIGGLPFVAICNIFNNNNKIFNLRLEWLRWEGIISLALFMTTTSSFLFDIPKIAIVY